MGNGITHCKKHSEDSLLGILRTIPAIYKTWIFSAAKICLQWYDMEHTKKIQ